MRGLFVTLPILIASLGAVGCAAPLAAFERSLERAGIAQFAAPVHETADTAGRMVEVRAGIDGAAARSSGRGAVIGPDEVVTVAHVLAGSSEAWVATHREGGWVRASVVRRIHSAPEDLVVLALERDAGWRATLGGFAGFPEREVYPLGTRLQGAPSWVVTARGVQPWAEARVRPGDSGAPVLDADGTLVALLSGRRGSTPVASPLTPTPGAELLASFRP